MFRWFKKGRVTVRKEDYITATVFVDVKLKGVDKLLPLTFRGVEFCGSGFHGQELKAARHKLTFTDLYFRYRNEEGISLDFSSVLYARIFRITDVTWKTVEQVDY